MPLRDAETILDSEDVRVVKNEGHEAVSAEKHIGFDLICLNTTTDDEEGGLASHGHDKPET